MRREHREALPRTALRLQSSTLSPSHEERFGILLRSRYQRGDSASGSRDRSKEEEVNEAQWFEHTAQTFRFASVGVVVALLWIGISLGRIARAIRDEWEGE